jgi:hypothetical protein
MFDRPTFQAYYASVDRMITDELSKERPEYLVQVDYDEYLHHLIAKVSWEMLELDESAMTMEPFIGKKRINDYGQPKEIDQPRIRLRIPAAPHPQRQEFLHLMPSSMRMSGEPEWRFQGDTLIVEADADEVAIAKALDEVRFWIGGRNNDVRTGNAQLRQRIEPIWKRKRQELETHHAALRTLTERVKIPLHQDSRAPKPLAVSRTPPRALKPPLRPGTPEPELERDSVLEIVDFVEAYARQLEVTPNVYAKLEEEALRDLVLSMLNVNYPGSSAETFSKKGKTDVFLRAGGGGSLVVECKRWTGPKRYGEALGQLFGYLTWRHGYGVLLTFSTNREMSSCILAAKTQVESHGTTVTASVKGTSSRFSSRHIHPQDRAKEVEVFHLFVDLATAPQA